MVRPNPTSAERSGQLNPRPAARPAPGDVDLDVYAVARLLHGHPLNGIAARVSETFRGLVEQLDAAAVEDREQLLEQSIREIIPEAEVEGFVEAVSAVDPNAPEPEEEPWESPVLGDQVAAVPFPVDILPQGLACLVREGARALQSPVDYFAVPALGIAGGAIGLSINLRVNTTWTEAPDLSLATVGPPGTRKSPAQKTMARPAYAIDKELREAYIKKRDEYKARKREWDAKARTSGKEKVDPGPEPEPPVHGHLTIDDTTREAVTFVHTQNPRGIMTIMDELAAWVASMNVYRSGKGDDKQFWMKVRSGSLVKVTRKGNPEPLIIVRPMVPVIGCMTPSSLPAMGEGPDDGWLDRILFSYPDATDAPPRSYTEEEISQDAMDSWEKAVRKLWDREMVIDEAGQARPFFVKLTDGARARWAQWVDAHYAETRAPDFDKTLGGPWSKIEGFTLRLALILSQLRWAYDPCTHPGENPADVSRQDVEGAARLATYFKVNFRRVKSELSGDAGGLPEDPKAILEWAQRNDKRRFSENEVNEALGRFRGDSKRRAAALKRLADHHCIRRRPDAPRPEKKRGRRPSPTYDVNPALTAGWRAVNTPGEPPVSSGNGVSLNKLNILNAPQASGPTQGEG